MIESHPMLSLVPPILAILLVIGTKKVIPSLAVGILTAAFLIADGGVVATLTTVWAAFSQIFWSEGELNSYYILILVFLLTLGVITSLVLMSGGTQAFAEWAMTRIRTRRGAQVLAAALGTAIFVDDYFNALAVGQVARPVSDRQRVSRAKLAYLIDSSSAPVAVLAPFSSWGASIIGIMGPIVAGVGIQVSDAGAFIRSAGMNYYAIAVLILLWITVVFEIDFGPMRREERRAVSTGGLYSPDEQIPGQLTDSLPRHEPGAMRALIVPFAVLVAGVVGGILLTGHHASGSWSILDMLASTDVALALNVGGVLGLATAAFYYFHFTHEDPLFEAKTAARGVVEGTRSMLPAIEILLCAWMLGSLISELGTGAYLGSLVESTAVSARWLIPVLFLIAGAMAFATGTSWGSFGILLPIAGEIMGAVADGEQFLIPAFGAVLAGAVWGDHCSPISDTTILSSTGAGCNHITHVTTQLPYAGACAGAALLGYAAFSATGSGILGVAITVAVLIGMALAVRAWLPVIGSTKEEPAAGTILEETDS
ncbi:Na+/H+ antiporter NhaC family protein [Actinomyces sp. MRS3W]|uniref:Na+/H+ antiporter NhaC family protein n=1 Tax=Actinomyces sp. MRS3W TaxID=2800796 RepID=UPI0028FD14D5|nr:Na+/H+ antiporter NhaC family protein [Actinomyces sp. MRS3W]MDU0349287.1 Na+/H+ antiporter NhaC family protein [Actinomyces sp. MRS3W]